MTALQSSERRDLTLTVKRPGPPNGSYTWVPFQHDENFEPSWWNEPRYHDDTYQYVEIGLDGLEVARLALGEFMPVDHYPTAPSFGDEALEIQLIEVSSAFRRRGIGTEVLRRIAETNPDRRLIAVSEDADEFWASLGWHRHDHPDGPWLYRPLFVQPEKPRV